MTAENDADREALGLAWKEHESLMESLEHFADRADFAAGFSAGAAHARQPGEPVAWIEDAVRRAGIEWSYHEDDNRYPRDFWHARIMVGPVRIGWRSYGEQEERDLPEEVKSAAEIELRSDLRDALQSLVPHPAPPAPVAVPDGWVLVPCTLDNNQLAHLSSLCGCTVQQAREIYGTILEVLGAAPIPPAGEDVRGLRGALEKAVPIIQDQRDTLFDCHTIGGRFVSNDEADDAAANAIAEMDACLTSARAALAALPAEPEGEEPFPQPKRRAGQEPCGECHIQPGETCDICGATHPATPQPGVRVKGGKLEEVGTTDRGYTIFREVNEVGGHRYWSDEIGGGVCVWDTCLADAGTLRECLRIEEGISPAPAAEEAFRRGAEAMRELCAEEVASWSYVSADHIRSLPLPTDKEG